MASPLKISRTSFFQLVVLALSALLALLLPFTLLSTTVPNEPAEESQAAVVESPEGETVSVQAAPDLEAGDETGPPGGAEAEEVPPGAVEQVFKQNAQKFTKEVGYFAILGTFLLFIYFLVKALMRVPWCSLLSKHRRGIGLIAVCSVFLHIHEPHQFKVLYDEYTLAATAMNIHFEREAATPTRAHFVNGYVATMNAGVGKRPLYFALLVSLVHDFTGYRPENVFVLNALLTPVLLALMYVVCVGFGGARRYGYIGVLLLTALPMVALNVTGGGFEILNAVMLLGLLVAGVYYLRTPGTEGLALLVLTTVLLAQTRYESMLFVLALALVVGVRWLSEREVRLTWLAAFSPLLLLPPLVVNQVLFTKSSLQLEGDQEAFGFYYFYDNVGHALSFLFDTSGEQTNLILLSVLGVVALGFMVIYFKRGAKAMVTKPDQDVVFFAALGVVLLNIFVLLVYYWGQLDDPMVSRLSLPLHLVFIIAICIVLKVFLRERRVPTWIIAGLAIYMMIDPIPRIAKSEVTKLYPSAVETKLLTDYLESTPPNTLALGHSTLPPIVHQRAAVPMRWVVRRQHELDYILDNGFYSEVLVLQRIGIHPETQEESDLSKYPMPASFVLEPIKEIRFRPNLIARLSRLVDVDLEKVDYELTEEQKAQYEKLRTGFDSESEQLRFILEQYP